jgi:hypothetical protein
MRFARNLNVLALQRRDFGVEFLFFSVRASPWQARQIGGTRQILPGGLLINAMDILRLSCVGQRRSHHPQDRAHESDRPQNIMRKAGHALR